jgi:hypothetical protein
MRFDSQELDASKLSNHRFQETSGCYLAQQTSRPTGRGSFGEGKWLWWVLADVQKVDSYDGFRSDYIHFSVSVTCPLREIDPDHPPDSASHNSLHLSPKAFAHFNSWWK